MCLYPRLILNPKYLPSKKNGYNPPVCMDFRVKYVPVGCGVCMECRKQKSRQWQVRLNEELKVNKGYFVTLTFTNEALENLCNKLDCNESNAVAGKAVRLFLERWRKKHKKSIRHWLITELGHQNTERIHLHGLIFTNETFNNDILAQFWQYGMTYTGDYCNEKTINYVVKYVTKIDIDHKGYEPQIFCSAGLGANYINSQTRNKHKVRKTTIETYKLNNGAEINLPIYYRNKLFNEEEREILWLEKIEKHIRYINGIECRNIDTEQGMKRYYNVLYQQQERNVQLGYGEPSQEWKKRDYNVTLKMLNKRTSTKN